MYFFRSLQTYSVPSNIQNIGEMGSIHQTKPCAPEASLSGRDSQ